MENRIDRASVSRRPAQVVNIWVIVGALVIGCLLLGISIGVLSLGRLSQAPKAPSTAVLQIIPAVHLTATLGSAAEATSAVLELTPVSTPGGEPAIGAYVQVSGTGGDGLRLRDAPGLNGNILLVASEAEVFKVDQGPVESDGYIWWHITGPFDETRQGWAVSSFLEVVQNP
jgi:hypothetical protein